MQKNVVIEQPNLDLLPEKGMFVDGKFVIDPSGSETNHIYAATGKVTTNVPMAGRDGVEAAVKSARKVLPDWRNMPISKRQEILKKFGELYAANVDRIAQLITIDNGMLTKAARNSVALSVQWISYYAGFADKLLGEVDEINPGRNIAYHIREPYGVVAILVPFNGPAHATCKQAATAMAVGNCVIVKPSTITPFMPSLVAKIFLEAGGPPGVFNVVPCRGNIGEMLVSHPGVDMVTLTGSTETGKAVMAAAAKNVTPVAMELGGKSPAIIFNDANLKAACQANLNAITSQCGQVCMKQSRILVQAGVYEKVIEMTKQMVDQVKVGDPTKDSTGMGPLVSESQCKEIIGFIERAKRVKGCRLVSGGERLGDGLAGGYFISPTIFADVDPGVEIYRKEVFGPVLTFTRFETEEEAIRMANDTNYGLAASVYTEDYKRAHRIALALESGSVLLNGGTLLGASLPFGGYKESGFSAIGGIAGIHKFTQTKTIITSLS